MAAATSAFGCADVGREVQRLAVQVGQLDHVAVHQAQLPDPGRRQVLGDRAAQRAHPDHDRARSLEPLLPCPAPLVHEQLARVALELVRREGHMVGAKKGVLT